MTEIEMFAALVAGALLLALVVAVAALRRLRRQVHTRVRRMIDAVPGHTPDDTAQLPSGLSGDLDAMERALAALTVHAEEQVATLDQACELAMLGTWTILPDMKSVRASSHIRAIFDFCKDADVIEVDAFRNQIVPEDLPTLDAALKRVLTERLVTDVEFRARNAAGDIRFFRARTGPDGDMLNDRKLGISGIIQDITDLRQNETALAQSLSLKRLTNEVARIVSWRYDVANRRFSVGPSAVRLLGLEADVEITIEEFAGRITDACARKQVERSFWTCVGTGSRHDEVAAFSRFDGAQTWLRMIGEAERDASGEIIAVYGAIQDVRELFEARHATEEVQTLLQVILNALGDGFIIHDRDGKIIFMNRMAHSILGASDLDLVGGNIWQDLPCSLESPMKAIVAEALKTGTRQTFEGEICMPDKWVDVAVHPTSEGVAIYLQDVTERRAERARMRLLDAALSNVSDVVLITEAKQSDQRSQKVVFVNDAFEKMTGYAPHEILGATPRILQGAGTEQTRVENIRRAIEAEKPIRTELTNYHKLGCPYTVEIDVNPVFDSAGICTHFVSVQRDTTKRRANEEYLRLREEQFRLAGLASKDIIWDWDLETGTIWNSDSSGWTLWQNQQDRPEKQSGGRIEDALERIHLDDRLTITESLNAALAGDTPSWRCEYRIMDGEGAWKNISDKAFIVRNDDGTPRRVVGAMSDVTEMRALNAQLHQSQKLETVGQLTGGIAHDFNNLLTIILGNCDIIEVDVDDGSALRPMLRSIEDAAERGARISSDLLAFARLQTLELRSTDINELIRAESGLLGRAVDESMQIIYDLSNTPLRAEVDPAKLEVGLLNLVINAAAAISDQGTITIRTRVAHIDGETAPSGTKQGDYIEIDVIDDGSGMTADTVERAFEPFFTTKEPGVGTGMGLSSVYGLMKQSGGYANIQSVLGEGTTITLGLPVTHKEQPLVQAEDPVPAVSPGGGQRILVVEDDHDLRAYVRTALTRMAYRIVEAETGAEALSCLEQDDTFDLLLTDIVMPGGVNGVDLARKAQELHPGLRVLFTSGYARETLLNEKQIPNDVAMLDKPFRTLQLLRMVNDTLARPATVLR